MFAIRMLHRQGALHTIALSIKVLLDPVKTLFYLQKIVKNERKNSTMDTTMNHKSYLPHLPPNETGARPLGIWSVSEQTYPHDAYLPLLAAVVLMTRQSWAAQTPPLPPGVFYLDAVPSP
jgi:hypothetical protein